MTDVTARSQQRCFGGVMGYYSHTSVATKTQMNFAVYQPPQTATQSVPVLYYLAGLTCAEDTFMIKAGAQRVAAELGLMLVACDTSPRGLDLPEEHDHWDFGSAAGFYLDATADPWSAHYRMGEYVNQELPALIEANFPARPNCRGIFGHSMGGHGALVSALRQPDFWQSVSAFAPICNPAAVPWGEKAFSHYLGADRAQWMQWDATKLMANRPYPGLILVDQGLDDQFLERELHPNSLQDAAKKSGQKLTLRLHEGYDHSYYFIQSFVEDHLRHHSQQLMNA